MTNRLKILFAQNYQNVEESIAAMFHGWGWEIISASDVENVLSKTQSEKPDAIVLDALFPGGASNVVEKLQSSLRTAGTPIIAVTGNTGPQSQELLSVGVRECMERPVDPEVLYAALQKLAGRSFFMMEVPTRFLRAPKRIAALQRTELLDSAPSDHFDAITKLAARILGVPVVLASLVDKDRQYFKSQHGLTDPWATSRQTPLSHSFCQWVVSGEEELVVHDARTHPVLCNNLAVRDLGVVAYAGLPLKAEDDQIIGSFCAIDTNPRTWTITELSILRDLSHVTDAYIAIGEEMLNSGASVPAVMPSDTNSFVAIQIAAMGISAIVRLLRRPKLGLSKLETEAILGILDTLSDKLIRLSTRSH